MVNSPFAQHLFQIAGWFGFQHTCNACNAKATLAQMILPATNERQTDGLQWPMIMMSLAVQGQAIAMTFRLLSFSLAASFCLACALC